MIPPYLSYRASANRRTLRFFQAGLIAALALQIPGARAVLLSGPKKMGSVSMCEISMRLTENYNLKAKQNRILVIEEKTAGGKGGHIVLISCNRNVRRTTNLGKLKSREEDNGAIVTDYREVLIDGRIPGALYRKRRKVGGGRVSSGEMYFATRDYEYTVKVAARRKASKKDLHDKKLLRIANDIKDIITISGTARQTISESEYLFRRNLLIMIIAGLSGIVLFFLLYRKRKKKKATAYQYQEQEGNNENANDDGAGEV